MGVIYESPDGGKTVYARQAGTNSRKIVREDDNYEYWNAFSLRYDWDDLADRHPAILEQLERLKVLVTLCKE